MAYRRDDGGGDSTWTAEGRRYLDGGMGGGGAWTEAGQWGGDASARESGTAAQILEVGRSRPTKKEGIGWSSLANELPRFDWPVTGGTCEPPTRGKRRNRRGLAFPKGPLASQNNLPSITNNTIYFDSEDLYPVVMYSVSSGTSELLSRFSIIHDYKRRIRPSVRPFTLADHLFTFYNHRCW